MSTAAELIHTLTEQGVTLRVAGDQLIVQAPKGSVSPETVEKLRERKIEVMAELTATPDAQVRRDRLNRMMDEDDSDRIYYWLTDSESDPHNVILAIGIRDVGTCEMSIPKEKYDPFLLMEILDRHKTRGLSIAGLCQHRPAQ